jgi:syntaxin-binding protein 1
MLGKRAEKFGSNMDKVRVIALYILFRDGVPEEDRRRLYEHSKLSRQERAAVDNLVHMCVRVTRVSLLQLLAYSKLT